MSFGHVKKYERKRKDADGNVTKVERRWRARYPDPHSTKATDQIERVFARRDEALAWLREESAKVERAEHVSPKLGKRLFATVAERWQLQWTDLAPKTRANYASALKANVLPRFGAREVASIDRNDVQTFINSLSARRAPQTVRNNYNVLRAVLDLAVADKLIASNPASGIKLPSKRKTKRRQNYLNATEVRALADAMPAHWRLALYVSAYCGLRGREQWALRRRDVDLAARELTIEHAFKEVDSKTVAEAERGLTVGPTKTHAERKLSVPAPLVKMLETHLEPRSPGGDGKYPALKPDKKGTLRVVRIADPEDPDALVFTTPDGFPVRHDNFRNRVFAPAVAKALPHLTPGNTAKPLRWHDLRHTCAALSLAVTPNMQMVQARLGHDDIRTTINIYGHMLPSVEHALADGLTALFEEAAPPADNVVALPAVAAHR